MARKANETAAPNAKPRDRKKTMMAPAVSAWAGGTFLQTEEKGGANEDGRRRSRGEGGEAPASTHLGPKHMQRLAKYPLEKEKTIMKTMYQASWWKCTGR